MTHQSSVGRQQQQQPGPTTFRRRDARTVDHLACPGMYKVKARIISTNPAKCGDEDGESLSYCLRFAIMLEEVDAEFVSRKQQHKNQMAVLPAASASAETA
ncbi:uncharacterized protein UTRI_02441 [Ustilago trichophora]|uniref:Uncharacterized protein n=1 Tax=Ustilago trichophora TaxID=86804 RepID=A0A5C3E7W5_9BASI|nr:uncharacterized protein UTRI_02441 [Ustilago trichophora]